MTGSLRRVLIVRTALAVGAALALAGVALDRLIERDLRRQFDRGLADKAAMLASIVELTPQGYELDFADLDMTEFEVTASQGFLELWRDDGPVLYRSPSLAGTDLPAPDHSRPGPLYHDLALRSDRSGRAVTLQFTPRREPADAVFGNRQLPLVLTLARDTSSMSGAIARFRLALLAVLLATVLVVAGTLAAVIRASLRPINRLATQIAGLDDGALDSRLSETAVPEEFRPVVGRLNELLERLRAAFARERTLAADVAHELRTPLAGLATTLEVTASRERSVQDYRGAIAECRLITDDMRKLVDNLLALARLESGDTAIARRPVSLARLLEEAWKPFREPAAARHLQIAWDVSHDGEVLADPALLEVAVRNLLDNAVSYTDEGGTISLRAGTVTLGVVNTGCALTQAGADELRGRFRRGDTARSARGAHCGLGLSLVASVADALGADLRIQAEPGGVYEVALVFPGHLKA